MFSHFYNASMHAYKDPWLQD